MLLPDVQSHQSSPELLLDWDTMEMLHEEFGVQRVYLDPGITLPSVPRSRARTPEIIHLLVPPLGTPAVHGPFLAGLGRGTEPILSLYPVVRLS